MLIIKNPEDLEKFLEDLRKTIHIRFKERVFGQFQELCERIVNNAFIETVDKYTKSTKLVQEAKMPFKDFVPEGDSHSGGEGAGFRDYIPAKEDKEAPKVEEQEKKPEEPAPETTDDDLKDMGIPKDKIDEFREKGKEEKEKDKE